jgi:hypothetical protein
MKNILATLLAVLLALVFSTTAFAQELKLSGEAKSGIFWKKIEKVGGLGEGVFPETIALHSKDDAGGENVRGRFRLNLDYDNGNGFGMKTRIQWQNWGETYPDWEYAFGYGNFFDDQMTVSVGKLGASPWGTGGPEMWKELELGKGGGMRVEWKPGFIPEQYGKLNVGFVLNWFNADMDSGWDKRKNLTLANVLRESVIGISYTHEYFHVRFAYRLDDEYDAIQENKGLEIAKGEDELIYRIEEYVIKNYLPYFKVWAMGYYFGISARNPDATKFENWLFAEYAPDWFTAQIRFGLDITPTRNVFHLKPNFYWNFFNKMLSVGASFWFGQDFGNKVYEGSPYLFMELEPKIQFNFASSYIAFAYNWRKEYFSDDYGLLGADPLQQTHWMNLRFCIYY